MAARGFGARHIAHQLIRCGTSIGANAEEAQEGQSKADYIAKMCVSSKEARETAYWLRLGIAISCVEVRRSGMGAEGSERAQVHDQGSDSHSPIVHG